MFLQTRSCIFPVLRLTFESADKVQPDMIRDGHYLGTGFFIALNETVVFVTARHVVDIKLEKNQRIGIGHLPSGGHYWWEYFEFHEQADLAFARFWPEKLLPFIHPLGLLPVSEDLYVGLNVNSFGFPFTVRSRKEGKTVIHVKEVFFAGHIASVSGRDELSDVVPRPFLWNYCLSFECPNGLSGAPLLTNVQGEPRVCGVIFGNQAICFRIEEYEEEVSEGRITRHEINKMHHFGLSSGHKELWEIPQLEE